MWWFTKVFVPLSGPNFLEKIVSFCACWVVCLVTEKGMCHGSHAEERRPARLEPSSTMPVLRTCLTQTVASPFTQWPIVLPQKLCFHGHFSLILIFMPHKAGNITWPLYDLSDCQSKRLRERICKGAKRPPRLPAGQSTRISPIKLKVHLAYYYYLKEGW